MILVDTGALYALVDKRDGKHGAARSFIESLSDRDRLPVLVELWFLIRARKDAATAFDAVERILDSFDLLPTEAEDLPRAIDIKRTFSDQKFSLVDGLVMAYAERHRIERIFTFDRRDFSVFRPSFCTVLTLLP